MTFLVCPRDMSWFEMEIGGAFEKKQSAFEKFECLLKYFEFALFEPSFFQLF